MIGIDPEFPLITPEGAVKAACHLYGKRGKTVYSSTLNYSFDVKAVPDGTGLELNTTGGESCRAALLDGVNKFLRHIYKEGFQTEALPVVTLPEDQAYGDAVRSGCAPEHYAEPWETKELMTTDTRPFAGHIHMSVRNKILHDDHAYGVLAKCCDVLIGTASCLVSPFPKEDALRRQYYGGPGAYRAKMIRKDTLLFEYRTPSASIYYHPSVVHFIWDLAKAMCGIDEDRAKKMLKLYSEHDIRGIIGENRQDDEVRHIFYKAYEILLHEPLRPWPLSYHSNHEDADDLFGGVYGEYGHNDEGDLGNRPSCESYYAWLIEGGKPWDGMEKSFSERWRLTQDFQTHAQGLPTASAEATFQYHYNPAFKEFADKGLEK